MSQNQPATTEANRITCQLCGALVHSISMHLRDAHEEYTLEDYKQDFPEAPLLSAAAQKKLDEKRQEKKMSHINSANIVPMTANSGVESMEAMHDVFKLGNSKAALNSKGNPIMIKVMARSKGHDSVFIPDVDEAFVYDIDTLKNILLGFDLNLPILLWGHAGTGKSSFFEQVCARTNRPLIRVQHTINTEESHIVGQWTVRDGATVFELGPLAVAMKEGHIYMADEYDFAMPSVLSVYQSVLEGKSLVIKEADLANRVIKPHPNFRFVATGNTNGSGDETGLYQGTNMQNSANYDRFGVTCKVNYMAKNIEIRIVVNQSGIDKDDAKRLVDFATAVREGYDAGKISATISPRALINAAKVGMRRGDYIMGINLAFANKLNTVDKEIIDGIAQRIIGE
jgi:cobaltochelatase CobS